jgi:ribose-phosphate pyrophosphokinase
MSPQPSDSAWIVCGNAHPELAHLVAQHTGLPVLPVHLGTFADGEATVRLSGKVEGASVFIVQPISAPVNENLVRLLLVADALRAAGAARVVAVVPYLAYSRQDVRKLSGEARSAQLAIRLLECAGIDALVVLELHSESLESAVRVPFTHVLADEAALGLIRKWRLDNLAVVSPDAGGLKRAQRYATALNAPVVAVAKSRARPDSALALGVLGEVRGRNCLLVDDMVSTGGTIAAAAEALYAAGAAEVHAFFVHAVMAPGALERIKRARVRLLGTTDSIAGSEAQATMVSVAPLLARAIAADQS